MIQESSSLCDFCNGPHLSAECKMGNSSRKMSVEQAQYLSKFPQSQFNLYVNNFNLSWRNHSNLSWRNNTNMIHSLEQVKPPPSQEKKASLDDIMSELAKFQLELRKSHAQFVNDTRTTSPINPLNLEIWRFIWLPCSIRGNKATCLVLQKRILKEMAKIIAK